MGMLSIGNIELRSVGIRARVGHGKYSTGVVLKKKKKRCIQVSLSSASIEGWFAYSRLAPPTFSVDRISSLNLRPHIEFPPLPVPVGSPVYV